MSFYVKVSVAIIGREISAKNYLLLLLRSESNVWANSYQNVFGSHCGSTCIHSCSSKLSRFEYGPVAKSEWISGYSLNTPAPVQGFWMEDQRAEHLLQIAVTSTSSGGRGPAAAPGLSRFIFKTRQSIGKLIFPKKTRTFFPLGERKITKNMEIFQVRG